MSSTPRHEVELYRESDAFVVVADLDDAEREDVNLSWHDGELSIVVEPGDPGEERQRVRRRQVGVHRPIDADAITATYGEGVLEVTLPIEDAAGHSGRRIDID